MTTLPAPVPHCPDHGPMSVVASGAQSATTRWCGVWYQCNFAQPRCSRTELIASSELLAQLAEQRAISATAQTKVSQRLVGRLP